MLLLAKQRGITSFNSLNTIKHALHTRKIGHTGTLDAFADGLLVVVSGRLTHLVAHITAFDKTYEAVIRFGTETDTLDPEGTVIASAALPSEDVLRSVIPRFQGVQQQVPPVYSAIQIQGHRASDLARKGIAVELSSRTVSIPSIELISYFDGCAHVRVSCSSGTYIRSLARDIAAACGSKGHLAALRRTRVGPFLLEEAAGYSLLPPFGLSSSCEHAAAEQAVSDCAAVDIPSDVIQNSVWSFTPELAERTGFVPLMLRREYINDFFNGKPVSLSWFLGKRQPGTAKDFAVFITDDGTLRFSGIINYMGNNNFKYGFVLGSCG